jgi:hypothetical protein
MNSFTEIYKAVSKKNIIRTHPPLIIDSRTKSRGENLQNLTQDDKIFLCFS